MPQSPEISVCVPLFNEEAVVVELCRRVREALSPTGMDWELVLVDDGSRDRTWELIRAECAKEIKGSGPFISRIRGVRLSRNFGLQPAASCALRSARGRAVVLMDGDLQDPPEMIPEMVARWKAGAEVVYTVKTGRDEPALRRFCFAAFHALFRRLAGEMMVPGAGLFSLMDRRALDALLSFGERHRYLPGLRFWVGFRQEALPFSRPARAAGQPKQSLRRLIALAFDGLLSFSKLPLRLATVLGLVVSFLSFVAALVFVGVKIYAVTHDLPKLSIPGWASFMTAISFFGGMQLLFLGIIGEYIGRIYDEVKGRPVYLVAEETGC
jgi:dolichol-phosphate mannosyltransferase